MTKQEVLEIYILELLAVVRECDEAIHIAYEKRNESIVKLNDALGRTLKEATDGD